jgi:glutaminase
VIAGITAAASGDLETLQRLETRGLKINAGDYDQRTPLHLAAANGHLHVVKYLIAHKANVNI